MSVTVEWPLSSHVMCGVQVGERIRVILDCEDNTLAFEKNYEFLGKYCGRCGNSVCVCVYVK